MMFTDTSFIGIEIPGARRPLYHAALDADLNMLAFGSGSLEDVVAFVRGQSKAFVAVNAPRRPNQGLMADENVRAELNPQPKPGRWDRWRVAEYSLRLRRIKSTRTPKDPSHAQEWMRLGFTVFSELDESGYEPYPQNFDLRADGNNGSLLYSLECYPHAAFTALLGHIPFTRNSLEGRIQRQLALYVNEVDVPDPMMVFEEITRHRMLKGDLRLVGLLEPSQLDALVAAYTARAAAKGEVTLLGHPIEGQVAVPVRNMLARYA